MTQAIPDVVVVDYGMGNLRNVARTLERAGARPRVTTHPDEVRRADRLVVPGVGALGDMMRSLGERGLVEALRERVQDGRPYLGICLGMQVLFEESEEGSARCLGVCPGKVARFPDLPALPVPHMGWNSVEMTRQHPVLRGGFFYFVHGYRASGVPTDRVLAYTDYGARFPSAVGFDACLAVQFPPREESAHRPAVARALLCMAAMRLGSIILIAGLSLGCVTPIQVEMPGDPQARAPRKLALVPFSLGTQLTAAQLEETKPEFVSEVVTARVLESLVLWTGFEIVPPAEVNRVLVAGGPLDSPGTAAEIGARLAASFGVDAMLFGRVDRFVPRIGSGRGASRPAAVRFRLELRADDGAVIWVGTYDEVQRSFLEDPGSLQRAMKRGFRWVTVEKLVQYGAEELVRRLPDGSWR